MNPERQNDNFGVEEQRRWASTFNQHSFSSITQNKKRPEPIATLSDLVHVHPSYGLIKCDEQSPIEPASKVTTFSRPHPIPIRPLPSPIVPVSLATKSSSNTKNQDADSTFYSQRTIMLFDKNNETTIFNFKTVAYTLLGFFLCVCHILFDKNYETTIFNFKTVAYTSLDLFVCVCHLYHHNHCYT
jgi:hypothetical protein